MNKKKVIITRDRDFSISWVRQDVSNRIRYSVDDISEMLVSDIDVGDLFLYEFMRYAMCDYRNLEIIIYTSNPSLIVDQISNDVKSRNSYNKRIKNNVIYELEIK